MPIVKLVNADVLAFLGQWVIVGSAATFKGRQHNMMLFDTAQKRPILGFALYEVERSIKNGPGVLPTLRGRTTSAV